MPKPSRCRRVCAEPAFRTFLPGCNRNASAVTLFVDEYEVIRLVDFEKQTHEQCAQQMEISRTTVTEIYEKARFKIADAIVNGKPLVIEGGHYRICRGTSHNCRGRCRFKQSCQSCRDSKFHGELKMKIAVPVKNEMIYQHFGMASLFKVYDVVNNQIVQTEFVQSDGRGHGLKLAALLDNAVTVVICGGIGEGAIEGLTQAGIELVVGISGEAEEAVNAYLAGGLQSNTEAACSKHHVQGQGHGHGHGHCGEHCDCHSGGEKHQCHCSK